MCKFGNLRAGFRAGRHVQIGIHASRIRNKVRHSTRHPKLTWSLFITATVDEDIATIMAPSTPRSEAPPPLPPWVGYLSQNDPTTCHCSRRCFCFWNLLETPCFCISAVNHVVSRSTRCAATRECNLFALARDTYYGPCDLTSGTDDNTAVV